MEYKKLNLLDYSDRENYLGIIYFNGQTSFNFMKANAIEGWVETLIQKTETTPKFPDCIRDEHNKPILVRLYGSVIIEELDKYGNKIPLENKENENGINCLR